MKLKNVSADLDVDCVIECLEEFLPVITHDESLRSTGNCIVVLEKRQIPSRLHQFTVVEVEDTHRLNPTFSTRPI